MLPHRKDNGLHRLIYFSRATRVIETATMAIEIATTSSPNNRSRALTGALLALGPWFLQVLEGPPDTIRELYDVIEQDARHTDLTVVSFEPIEVRIFDRWGMRAGKLAEGFGEELDLSASTASELLTMLRLSTLRPRARRAA